MQVRCRKIRQVEGGSNRGLTTGLKNRVTSGKLTDVRSDQVLTSVLGPAISSTRRPSDFTDNQRRPKLTSTYSGPKRRPRTTPPITMKKHEPPCRTGHCLSNRQGIFRIIDWR